YRDYLLLPEQDRRELIEGDFYMAPAPSVRHQIINANLVRILIEFVRQNNLGLLLYAPTDVVLSETSVVQPDILFISNERREIITEANISGAPDLVIEILSPGTAERDKALKLNLYARFGVREYWIVDPDEKSVRVMQLGASGYDNIGDYSSGSASSAVLPGLSIPLDEVFAGYQSI
ncbi:MAG: Uma2 family endonuclease, partial [Chloroflexi bacterium]|nr:Uma2 family endonuclease [Chloroflexota bacterium]